jgi:hypothetical protein
MLYQILSHSSLIISDEDSLYWYLSSRQCDDPACFHCLPFVRFEYLSLECIADFLSLIPEYVDHGFFAVIPYYRDRRIWDAISPRLIGQMGVEFSPVSRSKSRKRVGSADGIISYLSRKYGGNVHDKGIVTITSKSVHSENSADAVKNAADFTSDPCFWSNGEPDQWVCWDFHKMRIRSTHYAIRSCWIGPLRSWVLEGSLDGENWIEIDRRTDNHDLRDIPWTGSFAIANGAESRFVRLTQTGPNHGDEDELLMCGFEIFGTLLE